jgi:hypothetical protein
MRKFSWVNGIGGAVLALVVFLSTIVFSGEFAGAQSVFCPATVPSAPYPVNSVPNIMQISGNCTNPKIAGAASGSALASQAIGDLLGSSANQETSVAVKAIEERREAAPEACPSGEVLVDGICRARHGGPASPPPVVSAAPAPAARVVAKRSKTKTAKFAPRTPPVAAPPLAPVSASDPPAIYDQSFHIGSFAQGFGSYDHRTGDRNSVIDCCTAQPSNTNVTPLVLDASSTTTYGGFVGGIDATKRSLSSAQDGVVFGLLAGYTWTKISLGTTVLSTVPSRTASGSSSSSAHVDGPSVGAYVSYFNGPLSNDFLIKNDFLSLSENQSQILGFGACTCFIPNAPSFVFPQSGSASTNLDQLTISDDVNYRVKWQERWWTEPTVGAVYVNSSYASSAAALGLADGYIFRVQGGARIGTDSVFGTYHVTTVLTGLLFDDVIVHGNNIQGQSFGQSGDILSDQGKVQAQAIASINADFGHGVSASIQGNVYGARGIFGAGGQATLRMQW